jgi:hypothetical protein
MHAGSWKAIAFEDTATAKIASKASANRAAVSCAILVIVVFPFAARAGKSFLRRLNPCSREILKQAMSDVNTRDRLG